MSHDDREQAHVFDMRISDVLRSAQLVQRVWVSAWGRFSLFGGFLVCCIVGGTVYQRWLTAHHPGESDWPNGASVATLLLACVAAMFTYYQWADARREASLEKFYERLRLTNDRYNEWEAARDLVGHFWDRAGDRAGFERRMYTFLELDNLEYMVLRYQLGFVRKRLIWRAIRTFATRCESPAFRRLATELVSGSGYDPKTRRLAHVLACLAETDHHDKRLKCLDGR